MPTIIKRTKNLLLEEKRETGNPLIWQVRPNVWRPPTDVYETDAGMVVRIDVAGVQEDNVEVTIQGEFLLINGVRGDTPERRAYHQMEIPFGKFSIGVELPADVNTNNASMKYQDGFMTINLPKKKLVR